MRKISKRKLFLFLIIILIMIFVTGINLINVMKKATVSEENIVTNTIEEANYTGDYERTIEQTKQDFIDAEQIVPEYYNMLARLYEGEINTTDVYKKIYSLVYEIIPDTYENLKDKNESEIRTYFETNEEEIKRSLGIDNVSDYINFVVRACEISNNKYVTSSFDVNTFSNDGTYSTIDLNIEYLNINIVVEMKIINEKNNDNPDIIFKIK